jgi:hypothetical protein
LSLALGVLHPDYLMLALTPRQLADWRALHNVEPIGEMGAYYRTGIETAVLANIYKKRTAKAFEPTDFMPTFAKPKPVMKATTPDEIRDVLNMIADGTRRIKG